MCAVPVRLRVRPHAAPIEPNELEARESAAVMREAAAKSAVHVVDAATVEESEEGAVPCAYYKNSRSREELKQRLLNKQR